MVSSIIKVSATVWPTLSDSLSLMSDRLYGKARTQLHVHALCRRGQTQTNRGIPVVVVVVGQRHLFESDFASFVTID